MAKTLRELAGLAILLASFPAFALGLGEIDVKSRLNQPLSASISVTSSNLAELNSATVRLATNEDFDRAGIDRTDFLSSLEFEIKGDQVFVSSRLPAREPFISFLIEVRWSGGRLLREYTLLLDPPGVNQTGKPASEKTTRTRETETAPALIEPSAMSPAKSAPTHSASAGQSYGPVEPKETLWSIASKLRPHPSITMDQMMLAIFEANRAAFDGGLTHLHSGVTLQIPGEDEIRATNAADAKIRIQGTRAKPVRKPATPKRSDAAESKPEPVPAPAAETKIEKPVEIAPPTPVPVPAPAAVPKPAAVVPAPAAPAPAPAPTPAATGATPAPAVVAPASTTSAAATPVPSAPKEAAAAASAAVATPAAPAPASKSMVDEEPSASGAAASAPATAAAGTPSATTPSVAPAETVQPAAPPRPPPVAVAPAPVEEPEASFLENPLLLPAIAGIVLLGVGAFVFMLWKRRRAVVRVEPVAQASGVSSAAKFSPAAAAANLVPKSIQSSPLPAAKSAREKLEEDTRVTESALSNTAAMESTLASTQAAETTRTLSQTVAQEPEIARTASSTPRKVDFDVTAQFAAETVQINLDANDPLAEADFHLAYGLYDEAALLLKQAADKNPDRVELRTKLAEVYFAAGKADEFRKVAEGLKRQVPAAQWSKVAIMGQQLCPDAAAFKDAGGAAITADVDLAFDDVPASATPPLPVSMPAVPKQSESLEFNLDELQLPAPSPAVSPPKAADADDALQFDLGDLKLEEIASDTIAKPSEIKLDEMNLDQFDSPQDAGQTLVAEASPTVSKPAHDMPTGGDEVATKLDLARAYMDMGDTDMAKSLLGEVSQQGDTKQKSEAQGLLSRLGA